MSNKRKELLKKWQGRMRDAQRAYYITSTRYKRLNYIYGIPVVCFTVFISSSVFSELQKLPDSYVQLIVGFVSVVAAIMAAVQTFLRFPEKAEKHRATAVRYGLLKKEIEKFLVLYPSKNEEAINRIENIKKEWDVIVSESPTVSSKLWRSIKGRDGSSPGEHINSIQPPTKNRRG